MGYRRDAVRFRPGPVSDTPLRGLGRVRFAGLSCALQACGGVSYEFVLYTEGALHRDPYGGGRRKRTLSALVFDWLELARRYSNARGFEPADASVGVDADPHLALAPRRHVAGAHETRERDLEEGPVRTIEIDCGLTLCHLA